MPPALGALQAFTSFGRASAQDVIPGAPRHGRRTMQGDAGTADGFSLPREAGRTASL